MIIFATVNTAGTVMIVTTYIMFLIHIRVYLNGRVHEHLKNWKKRKEFENSSSSPKK